MTSTNLFRVTVVLAVCLGLAACGGRRSGNGVFSRGDSPPGGTEYGEGVAAEQYSKSSIWDIVGGNKNDQTVNVNRYLWAATLDVLNFLPVQSVDPFTGVIITGFGTPPGGSRSYRATVHILDPALEARSLNVALHSRNGSVSAATTRAVEDAILSRARQMRIGDNKL